MNNVSNFAVGEWTSVYHIKPDNFEGVFNIRNHFYESNNMLYHRKGSINRSLID
jgi:hypothetical protein